MKVGVIISVFPNSRQKDRGIFVYRRLEPLKKYVSVIVSPTLVPEVGPRKTPAKQEKHGVFDVIYPRSFSIPKYGKVFDAYLMYRSLLTVKELRDVDIIDAHFGWPDSVAAYYLARKLGKPLMVTLRGSDMHYWYKKTAMKKRMDEMFTYANVITVGKSLGDFTCIPNGVGEDFTPRNIEKKDLGLPEGKVMLTVGNDLKRKGVYEVIRALPDDVHYVVVGEHKPERRGNVLFLGRKNPEEIWKYYNACDVYCLMSQYEGCPNSILEALACHTPVLSSHVGEGLFDDSVGMISSGNLHEDIKEMFQRTFDFSAYQKRTWDVVAQEVLKEWQTTLHA